MKTSEEICEEIAKRNDSVILFFSRGKDSIGAWIQIKKFFKKIYPVYMYNIPDLKFIDDSLKYYEDFYGCEISRFPNPSITRMIDAWVFSHPLERHYADEAGLRQFTFDDVSDWIKRKFKLPENVYTATGVKMNDTMDRRVAIQKNGGINEKRKVFYPIFDWNNYRLYFEIKESGVKLPVDYKLFGRTFDGLQSLFVKPLKEYFPEDYKKVLEYFPLCYADILRIKWRAQHV